ncbi:Aspartic peptidase A1 [Mycena indigotica]|uniref:Aspartic peptidase A1 n=1 Tax=Mycena indigotica TaxID=2126181 RepID=A0A8H6T4L3_9AGAR|nr:Aspartic peptidase A1 [Mycena indigotica]KAF7309807.1 Aspartic peptidase A1 [Mycena indigotica]
MFTLSTIHLPIIALLLSNVVANPTPQPNRFSMPIQRRLNPRSIEDFGAWAKSNRAGLTAKYGGSPTSKRSTGTNLLTNQGADSSYFGSLAIGNPAASFNVILDTGSADLWVAGSSCRQGCSSVPTFNPSGSSSFVNESTRFQITYGSGAAAGVLATDTVQMAGFSVSNQIFAVCDAVSSGLLTNPVSGLLGLAWQSIASSGATPLWQTLAANSWDSPVMAFQLTRFLNQSRASDREFGGSFTMGFVNNSLYTGDIEYINMPTSRSSYWILPITALTVQGNSVAVPSGVNSYAAIDTGTTLVGGPETEIANIYAQIPDSRAGTGDFDGYYLYPCDTRVTVSLSFGGSTWTISPDDFALQEVSRGTCVGSFFALSTGNTAPSWIVGDTFLVSIWIIIWHGTLIISSQKNVYSVFRYNPPSIGFAKLSQVALAMNGNVDLPVPSATIGSVSAQATAGNNRNSSGVERTHIPTAALSAALTALWLLTTMS